MTEKPIPVEPTDEAVKRERERIEKNAGDAAKLIADYDASRADLPNAEKLEADYEALRSGAHEE
jgi:hypothetical protein